MSESKKLFEKLYIQKAPSWSVEQDEDGGYKYHATQSAFALFEILHANIEQLKAKNTQLTHALVNANAEKSKWQKDYWQLVERNAEYGAMLISDPSSLEYKCYQKEKQNEWLKKQLEIQQVLLDISKPKLHKTDMGDCLHFSTTMFHEGKAECFDCGAVVNQARKVIGIKQALRGAHE